MNYVAGIISIFTVNSLRSPAIRQRFKTYTDKARASRAEAGLKSIVPATRFVNTNRFENQGIIEGNDLHFLASLS